MGLPEIHVEGDTDYYRRGFIAIAASRAFDHYEGDTKEADVFMKDMIKTIDKMFERDDTNLRNLEVYKDLKDHIANDQGVKSKVKKLADAGLSRPAKRGRVDPNDNHDDADSDDSSDWVFSCSPI